MSNALNELHGRMARRSRQRARGGRHFMSEARKFAGPPEFVHPSHFSEPLSECEEVTGPQQFELTTDDHALEYLDALFDAAVERGLDPLLERRRGQTVFRIVCSAVDWASVRMEAMRK